MFYENGEVNPKRGSDDESEAIHNHQSVVSEEMALGVRHLAFTSALATIEITQDDGYDGSQSDSSDFDDIEWGLPRMHQKLQLGDLTAEAAQVIQKDWKQHLRRRQLLLRSQVVLDIRSPLGLLLPMIQRVKVKEYARQTIRASCSL